LALDTASLATEINTRRVRSKTARASTADARKRSKRLWTPTSQQTTSAVAIHGKAMFIRTLLKKIPRAYQR